MEIGSKPSPGRRLSESPGNRAHPPPAVECGDLSPLSTLGGLVHPAPPRAAVRSGIKAIENKPATHDLGGEPPAESGETSPHSKVPWPHAPIHKLDDNAVYFVTASTLHKEHLFQGPGAIGYGAAKSHGTGQPIPLAARSVGGFCQSLSCRHARLSRFGESRQVSQTPPFRHRPRVEPSGWRGRS